MAKTVNTLQERLYEIERQRKWESGNGFSDAEAVVELSMEFTEHAKQTGDLRYLNTALKLNDWVREHVHDKALIERIDRTEMTTLDSVRTDLGIDE